MTDEQLAAIRARCEAATPGPWKGDADDGTVQYELRGIHNQLILTVDGRYYESGFLGDNSINDEAFVTHSWADVTALLAEIERLRAENADLIEANNVLARDRTAITDDCFAADMARFALLAEVERLRAATRWTPVSEALPEQGRGACLVYVWSVYGYRYATEARRDVRGWRLAGAGWVPEGEATHWMPLPELPKGGDDD